MTELTLKGIDGGNPLGFLAALGVMALLDEHRPGSTKMTWVIDGGHRPVIHFQNTHESSSTLAMVLADCLGVPAPEPEPEEEKRVESLYKKYSKDKKEKSQLLENLGKRRTELRKEGGRAQLQGEVLKQWVENHLEDFIEQISIKDTELQNKHQTWLTALNRIAQSPELRLGKTLAITPDQYREAAEEAVTKVFVTKNRRVVEFLAAFGVESLSDGKQIKITPFCFISGSGHQYFLDTIRKLMQKVKVTHLEECLFKEWVFQDERLSLRWAPVEDRRYALAWDDPGGQEVRTVWAANLLAYHGLRFLPLADIGRRLGTTGFVCSNDGGDFFYWPIWQGFLNADVIRSVLSLQIPHFKYHVLESRGIYELFRCERIKVGDSLNRKINFGLPASVVVEEKA